MGFWSWLRALWSPPSGAATSDHEDGTSAADRDDDQPASTAARVKAKTAPASADSTPARILAGTIDDYNGQAQIGLITLADGALIGFGSEACEEFTPLIGLRVAIHGTGVPPEATLHDPSELPGLWALRVRLWPGSESEYAARLRIHQVERALRGAGERGDSAPGEPPWARGKNRPGRKPSGPGRPADAFFVLTVVLSHELPKDAANLSAMIDPPDADAAGSSAAADPPPPRRGGVWRRPSVRIIPLIRNQQTEPGFSAELQSAGHRAFLLHRPQPYGDEANRGTAHAGLFVGGPHSPRVAAQLSDRHAQAPVAVTNDAARILADLARAILLAQPDAPGVVLNRAGKAFKPRDIALSQLGETPSEQIPFVFWIDWNRGERAGRPFLLSSGLEILALPDLAIALPVENSGESATPDDAAEARARDVLLYICDALLRGSITAAQDTITVPRSIRMLPGSRLETSSDDGSETYTVTARSDEWTELTRS